MSGIGCGTLIMPLVAAELIDRIGWRGAWIVLALAVALVGGAAALFVDNSPERHGALPDGGVVSFNARLALGPVEGVSLREAVTSRAFIALYLSLVSIWIGASIPFVHLVPYAEDHGLSHGTAVAMTG